MSQQTSTDSLGTATPISISSSTPLVLIGETNCWVVSDGPVDIFLTPLQQGQPAGRRHYLFQVPEGGILLGLPDTVWGLVAVGGINAEVRPAVIESLLSLPPSQAVAHIDPWILALSESLAGPTSLWPEQVAPDSGQTAVKAGSRLYGASQSPVWVQADSGQLLYQGRKQSQAIPITPRTWVESPGDAQINSLSTIELLDNGQLPDVLKRFHQEAAERLAVQHQEWELQSRKVKERSAALETNAVINAFQQLRTVISTKKQTPFEQTPPGEEMAPELGIARLMAQHLGIDRSCWDKADETHIIPAAPLKTMEIIFERLGIRSRQVILRDDWYKKDGGPLIVFEEDGTTCALIPNQAGGYTYHSGTQDSPPENLDKRKSDSFDPIGLVLYRPLPDQPIGLWTLFEFALTGIWRDLHRLLLAGKLLGLIAAVTPVATGLIFDYIIPNAAFSQLNQIVFALAMAALGTASFTLVRALALLRINGRMDWTLQSALFDRLLRLPTHFFKAYNTGDLADRALGFNAIRGILSGVLISSMLGAIFSVFSLVLLFYYSASLALLAIALIVVAVFTTVAFSLLQLRHDRNRIRLRGRVEGLVLQLIIGVSKLRTANAQQRGLAAWIRRYAEQKQQFIYGAKWENRQQIFHAGFPVLANIIIFAGAIKLVQVFDPQTINALSPGAFLAFHAAFGQLFGSLTNLALSISSSLIIIPLYERSRPIIDAIPESGNEGNRVEHLDGDIELSEVTFRYQEDSPDVLTGLNLHIKQGEFVALVGSSGSGKSTLFRLMLGFEQAQSGEIFYDGRALSSLDQESLRRKIGVVLQHSSPNAGSLFETIAGNTSASVDDAWRAARLVGLAEDIEAMPMGMYTVVTDGASTLSGGQRQRIMIARALVRQPQILLLDEATSALDNRTQAVVSDSISQINITRIVIAHRLFTIRNADRIFVIDNGKVAESGNFEELMAADGLFKQLAKRQLL